MADDIAKELAAPFPPDTISWRIGATNRDKTRGLALAYIDARDVMNRLDEVLGIWGWKSEHVIVGDRTMCRLSILNPDTGEWVSRTDGAGDSDVEAEKGAFSASLKRSAVAFGIGRYLYNIDAPWVELEPKGTTHVIPERELAKLRVRLSGKQENADAHQNPPVAPSANEQLTLAQIRDAIIAAINTADSEDRARGILRNHKFDLDLILGASKMTYNRIIWLAKAKVKSFGGVLDDWELA